MGNGPTPPTIDWLRFPKPVPLRKVWPTEPAHFTPWLAHNLHVLEVTGLAPLELVDTEVAIPGTGRALDILARLGTGELVAIENQFASADHDHLTRGLAYAVGLGAAALILVAESHLNEFRAVAGYLNDVAERSEADRRIGVYLVALSAEAIEEYVVPRFTLMSSPNPWVQAAAAATPPPGVGNLDDFLLRVPDQAREAMTDVTNWWAGQPGGSVRYGAQTAISLDRPHPARPGPLSHLLLNTSGNYTVQRGYLLDAGVVPEAAVVAFDGFLRETFPDLNWSGKHYYLNSQGPPRLEAFQRYAAWLAETGSAGAAAEPSGAIALAP